MRRRLRWGDVWPVIRKFSAPKIKRLRRHCLTVMERAPPDSVLRVLRLHAVTYFRMYEVAFKLSFDFRSGDWVLTLHADSDGPRRPPSPPTNRRAPRKRAPARAAGARPQRKATLKRISFNLYKTPPPWALGKFLPLLARTVETMKAAAMQLPSKIRRLATTARFTISPCAVRLEPVLCGASAGLPMVLYTFASSPAVQDRQTWRFIARPEFVRA